MGLVALMSVGTWVNIFEELLNSAPIGIEPLLSLTALSDSIHSETPRNPSRVWIAFQATGAKTTAKPYPYLDTAVFEISMPKIENPDDPCMIFWMNASFCTPC